MDTPNATSSLESAAGLTPLDSPVGRILFPSGPVPVPVSLSQWPDDGEGLRTIGIFGQTSVDSSCVRSLRLSWVSRLAERLGTLGSTEWHLTWRKRHTPAGRVIFQLAPSTRRTYEIDCTAWPTPANRDWKGDYPRFYKKPTGMCLPLAVRLTGWATPDVPNGGQISGNLKDIGRKKDGSKSQVGLGNQARLTITGKNRTGYSLGHKGWEIRQVFGGLNPNHSRWLMGYPIGWLD